MVLRASLMQSAAAPVRLPRLMQVPLGKQVLPSWLAKMAAPGEVQHVTGPHSDAQRRRRRDAYQRKTGNKAVLFDDVPGYPHGHRVIANILTSIRRIHLTLGNPADSSALELVHYWRRYMKEARTFPPRTVNTGAVLENVDEGKSINLFKIPVPKW